MDGNFQASSFKVEQFIEHKVEQFIEHIQSIIKHHDFNLPTSVNHQGARGYNSLVTRGSDNSPGCQGFW